MGYSSNTKCRNFVSGNSPVVPNNQKFRFEQPRNFGVLLQSMDVVNVHLFQNDDFLILIAILMKISNLEFEISKYFQQLFLNFLKE